PLHAAAPDLLRLLPSLSSSSSSSSGGASCSSSKLLGARAARPQRPGTPAAGLSRCTSHETLSNYLDPGLG
ncbi:hypothetical protein ETH_00042990, partial [Eimeria tenella]